MGISSVFAEVSSIIYVQNEKGTAKDFVYGSSSDKPYLRSTFNIYKGWNLVPIVENGNAPSRGRNTYEGYGDRILGCGLNENFDSWQIKYQYNYIPGKGYVGGELDYNTGGLKEPAKTRFETALRDYYMPNGNRDDLFSLMFTSQWFYSEIDCSYPLSSLAVEDAQKQADILDRVKLNSGWNLISIMPAFLDKNLRDSFGNCNVLKVNAWNPVEQKWEYSSSESNQKVSDLLNTRISEELLFTPLVVQVETDCTLGASESNINPPAIPN